ncbi:MAG: 30S ribosomal protein S17 [Deltaproteobacteria bacterium RBG_16_71_12]|nr:MAG: 30S ribosomal protein S17 [Deltaproteobacteria bacterium RBG_16_71_12]
MSDTKQDQTERGTGRTLRGVVKSDKMAKTISVEVIRTVRHAKYNKFIKKRARYYAHDEQGQAHVGDTVDIVECRPTSKLKRWRLANIAEKAST